MARSRNGLRLVAAVALLTLIAGVGIVAVNWSRFVAWYHFREIFEPLGKNSKGLDEFRHRATACSSPSTRSRRRSGKRPWTRTRPTRRARISPSRTSGGSNVGSSVSERDFHFRRKRSGNTPAGRGRRARASTRRVSTRSAGTTKTARTRSEKAAAKFERGRKSEDSKLIKAHETAVKAYTRKLELEKASAVRKSLKKILDGRPVPAPNPRRTEPAQKSSSRGRALSIGKQGITSVATIPRRSAAVSVDDTGRLVFWNLDTGKALKRVDAHSRTAMSVSVSANGRIVATGGEDGRTRVWNARTGGPIGDPFKLEGFVWSVALSSARDFLAIGTDRGALRIIDWKTHKRITGVDVRGDGGVSIRALSFSHNGERRIFGGGKSVLGIDIDAGFHFPIGSHTGLVTGVAGSFDGTTALSGSWDGTVKLWSVEDRKELRRLESGQDALHALVLSPDGKRAAVAGGGQFSSMRKWSGGKTPAIRLYDVSTGKRVATLRGHEGPVFGLCFSSNGKTLVSGSLDGTVRVWPLD